MKRILILCFFLSLFFYDYSQKQQVKIDSIKTVYVNVIPANTKEEDIYKLLYENQKKASEDLRNTQQWAIGIVAVFIALILGSQIYFNWKINKQELTNINSELESKIKVLELHISSKREEDNTKLETTFEKLGIRLKTNIDEKTSSFKEIMESKLESVSKSSKNDLKILEYKISESKADIYMLKGWTGNAFSSYIDAAIIRLDLGYAIEYDLDDFIKVLPKVKEIFRRDYERLEKLITDIREKHKDKFESQLKEIEENYKNKPVYDYESKFLETYVPGTPAKRIFIKNAPVD